MTRSKQPDPLIGRWRITEMDEWDRETLDLMGPAFIEFREDGTGPFAFIAVEGWMDCRPAPDRGIHALEFTWAGRDELDPANGRGWAALTGDGRLKGHIWFHLSMDSGFTAEPFPADPTGVGETG